MLRNSSQRTRDSIHIAFAGHVDHGKSTLAGRTLYELGYVGEEVMTDYREQAALGGKKTFEYAWIMDLIKEERARGLTIQTSYKKIVVDERQVIIVDGPGHPDYSKNMLLGISEADAAVLVVDARQGIMPQTREHAIVAGAFGINQLVVVINKMDLPEINFDEERYNELRVLLTDMLINLGYRVDRLLFVPASAYYGENITKPSTRMEWYHGRTFYQSLSWFESPDLVPSKPFRMPIDEVRAIPGIGTVVTGKVASGRIAKGDEVFISPQGVVSRIRSIEEFHKRLDFAMVGDDVGIAVPGVDRGEIRRGSVLGTLSDPPRTARRFIAKVRLLDASPEVRVGFKPTIAVHSDFFLAAVVEIISRTDPDTGEVLARPPQLEHLGAGDTAYIEFATDRPVAIEVCEDFQRLGRFVVWDRNRTVGIGTCVEIVR